MRTQNAFEGALPSELLDLLTIVLRLQQQLLLQHAEQDLDLEDAVLLVPDGAWLAKAILRVRVHMRVWACVCVVCVCVCACA